MPSFFLFRAAKVYRLGGIVLSTLNYYQGKHLATLKENATFSIWGALAKNTKFLDPFLERELRYMFGKWIFLLLLLTFTRLAIAPPVIAQTDATSPVVAKEAASTSPIAPEKPAGPQAKGFFEILFSGGLIGIAIMLALIALSLTAAYLVFDNLLSLRKEDLFPAALAEQVHTLLQDNRYEQAAAVCQKQPSILSFIMSQGLREVELGWADTEKALEEALAEQAARLYRRVEYLSVIGSLAPMLGLLGTVTGMLMAFQEVAISQGAAGAAELAEGIYQALVTTVVGLIIAIPALGAFAIFRNRVDQLVAEGAYMIQHAFGPLKRQRTTTVTPAPPPPPPTPPSTTKSREVRP
jgi:biopolymer transport protein ExbB